MSDATIADPIASPVVSTSYIVEATDNKGCQSKDTVHITINPLPAIALTHDTVVCEGGVVNLWASGGSSYSWYPSTFLTSMTNATATSTPDNDITYYVIVTDSKGCLNTDSVRVRVVKASRNLNLMASAFTPNNDGKNDCFGLTGWEPISKLNSSIYNQWGQKVFFTSNPADCWDGVFKGEPQSSGAFVYIIKAFSACGLIDRKGIVTLIR